jgi:hypothetical protein
MTSFSAGRPLAWLGTALFLVAPLLGTSGPAHAQSAPPTSLCAQAVDPDQAQRDAVGLATARHDGLAVGVARQCRGFSVVADEELDPAAVDEYAGAAQQAYTQLAADSQRTLAPRALIFLFPDEFALDGGTRVLARMSIRRSDHATPPGFALLNSVWFNDDEFPDTSDRLAGVAHEFTHLFVGSTVRGKTVPSWLNEGLAVHYQFELPAAQYPEASAAHAAEYRRRLIQAADGTAPVALFHLDEISSWVAWNSNYGDPWLRRVQYAEGHAAVRWLINRKGLSELWSMLRSYGDQTEDFATALRLHYGLGIQDVDDAVHQDILAAAATAQR